MATKVQAVLALAGVLLLGACNQQASAPLASAPTVTSPAPSVGSLGLYELHVSTEAGKLTSSVTRVGGGALSAQEISGLSFSATAAQNTDNASGKRYKVAITVNNGSGKEINQPLYVPVAVTGYSQDDTYFRNAKDVSGAGSVPTGIIVEEGDTATPLVTTNVSPSLISVPNGMSVSKVSPQAWRAPTLAAGASQTVTFGFNIPSGNTTQSFNVVFGVFATPKVGRLVISQVYGGGGNTGAQYKNDFIEVFNPTNGDVNLAGYEMEYFSSSGGSGGKTSLSGTVKAGGYFLVQQAEGATSAPALPTPDATGTLALSGTNGAVTLSTGGAVIDTVGYGSANKFEGKATAVLSNTTAALRNNNGCTDANNNSTDFTVAPPAPRNSATPINVCQ